jgi:septum formation protein
LASRSPQRSAILAQLGIPFEVRPADVVEREAGDVDEVVRENALAKARAVAATAPDRLVLGVDTEVVLDGRIYGKPADRSQARSHLIELSGRAHVVASAVALVERRSEEVGLARTEVRFRALAEDTIEWYLDSDEWRERAGGYAIQGRGAALVERIEGDFWNVVGLPVPMLLEMAPQLLQ